MLRDLPLPRRPRGRRRLVVALASLLVAGAVASPATAQVDPPSVPEARTEAEQQAAEIALLETLELAPEAPASPDDPFVAVVAARDLVAETAVARLEATAQAQAANLRAIEAVGVLQQAQAEEAAAEEVRDAAIDELASERRRLSDLTVQAYVKGGADEIEQYRAFVEGDTSDPAAGREIMFRQVLERQRDATDEAEDQLRATRAALREVRADVADATDEAGRRLGIAKDRTDRRVRAESAHVQALGEQADADAELRSAGDRAITPVPLEVPIIGLPRLSAEDLATWFEASPYRPRVSTPMIDYARWFIEEGRAEGIRGDIAFAQAVLETGGFTNTDSVEGHNFSGIGHYDNLARGWSFPSPQLGVRAQIQLLKSYAVATPNYVNELVDRRLRGPAGCCETWGDLTTVWATDPTYGPKVMLLYTSLVDHALDRRARGEGFDDALPTVEG
jgi:hypothetical protein